MCIGQRDKDMPEQFIRTDSIFALYKDNSYESFAANNNVNLRQISFITILRPYAIQLLANLYKADVYDLAVFSMGSEDYVNQCANLLCE